MENTTKQNPTVIFQITVSAEQAEKLYTAYCGLPDNRKKIVEENRDKFVKEQKLENIQALKLATFHEIFQPKLDHYYENGLEVQENLRKNLLANIASMTAEQKAEMLALLK